MKIRGQIAMVALTEDMIQKIRSVQGEIEPHIVDMIRVSNASNCPFKVMMEGNPDSKGTKAAITRIARMLYKHNLLDKLNLSLSDEQAYGTILYAFGYWGGQTLTKHGDNVCDCSNKCY